MCLAQGVGGPTTEKNIKYILYLLTPCPRSLQLPRLNNSLELTIPLLVPTLHSQAVCTVSCTTYRTHTVQVSLYLCLDISC